MRKLRTINDVLPVVPAYKALGDSNTIVGIDNKIMMYKGRLYFYG